MSESFVTLSSTSSESTNVMRCDEQCARTRGLFVHSFSQSSRSRYAVTAIIPICQPPKRQPQEPSPLPDVPGRFHKNGMIFLHSKPATTHSNPFLITPRQDSMLVLLFQNHLPSTSA